MPHEYLLPTAVTELARGSAHYAPLGRRLPHNRSDQTGGVPSHHENGGYTQRPKPDELVAEAAAIAAQSYVEFDDLSDLHVRQTV